MYSLFHALLAQHARQLTPIRCGDEMVQQLHRYFEDVALENSAGLVIESLPFSDVRSARDLARVRSIGEVAAANAFFLVAASDQLSQSLRSDSSTSCCIPLLVAQHDSEQFVVIADARFSALLATAPASEADDRGSCEVIWTFEPDIVYSALEYLMARIAVEFPDRAAEFSNSVRRSTPKATSLQITVSVITKLARLLQAHAEREIAIYNIATAIRQSFDLDQIIETAAAEVCRSLQVDVCAVQVEGEAIGRRITRVHRGRYADTDSVADEDFLSEVDSWNSRLAVTMTASFVDGEEVEIAGQGPLAAVPLIYHNRPMGLIYVRSQDQARTWAENERRLLQTVADQLTVAVNQAYLFGEMQRQALTDSLTGCYNRRSFDMQLERDLQLATRMRQPLSLIMLDLDNFKDINDYAGHELGDQALRSLADILRAELRAVDTAARFGGDEFAVILPQATIEGAQVVAERLRARIRETTVTGYGPITASLGIGSFPHHATSRHGLVVAADQALYHSKRVGRNRVSLPTDAHDLGSPNLQTEEDALMETLSRL
jgi:diguanylate cyclase (GGDEF)-like protein